MPVKSTLSDPQPAKLDNPLYYLENARTLMRWVVTLHGDLLTEYEKTRLEQFAALPGASQALLLRMVMRTHDRFRLSTLDYPETGRPLGAALAPLVEGEWVDPAPALSITELGRLFRRDELIGAFATAFPKLDLKQSTGKAVLLTMLEDRFGTASRTLDQWWQESSEGVVSLRDTEFFRRIRLMFFGNLRQDWSEFVVTALGYQNYEKVSLSPESRAFQTREEVDLYLKLYDARQQLEESDNPAGIWAQLWETIPAEPVDNHWLNHRRCRLLHLMGLRAERCGLVDEALMAYRRGWLADSRIRYFRVLEKQADPVTAWDEIVQVLKEEASEAVRESLQRILRRLAKRVAKSPPATGNKTGVETFVLELLPEPDFSVEQQVAMQLSDRASECFCVENALFNSLLGLLCWPALYAPVPGAFFHPFQAGPADLYREEFVARRSALIAESLNTLDTDMYLERIRHYWQTRQGIACPLVAWPILTESLLTHALQCIPAQDLKAVFGYQLADLSTYRRGMPDLVRFWPRENRYELVEVKAPGDRLQDHQRRWFDFFNRQGIPARVCHVSWSARQ